jgi:hypothetical protein
MISAREAETTKKMQDDQDLTWDWVRSPLRKAAR